MLDKTPVEYQGDGWQVHRMDLPFPIPPQAGAWLVAQGLQAQGNDFTSEWARTDPDYHGTSLLRQLWEGYQGRAVEGITRATLWIVAKEGQALGIMAWLRTDQDHDTPTRHVDEVPNHPNHHPKLRILTAPVGQVMCYLDASLRGRGVMKHIARELLAPALTRQADEARTRGAMPFVCTSDATTGIVASVVDIPIVEHFGPSLAQQTSVWRHWQRARMYPEDPGRAARYLVPPEPVPARKRQPRR